MRPVGLVKYLNALPLTHALSSGKLDHDFALVSDVPSKLADDLKETILDIALIPAIEYGRLHEPHSIIPDICIGSEGPAASVLLFFNKDMKNLKKIALDTSSRTSVALTKILLTEKFGFSPEYIPMAPDLGKMLASADAALIIGDKALEYSVSNQNFLDLAEEWHEWTGLPFVFAFWVGKSNAWSAGELKHFKESKKLGMDNLDNIAAQYARNHPQDVSFYRNYLKNNIKYSLNDDFLEGLNAFLEMAFYHSLIDNLPQIKLFDTNGVASISPQDLFSGKN